MWDYITIQVQPEGNCIVYPPQNSSTTSEINIKKISNWATGHSSLKKTDYVQTKYATLTQLTLLALHVCTQLSYHVNQSDHELLLLSWLCVWQNHNLVNLAKPFWESRVEWWWCWQWIKKSCCENGLEEQQVYNNNFSDVPRVGFIIRSYSSFFNTFWLVISVP